MPSASVELDLRRAKRYLMSAAVSFCWDDGSAVLREGRGTTLDISSRGVFVMTDEPPRAGLQLELDIYLRSPGTEFKVVRFHGEGKVVRAIEEGPESGFAAEVLFHNESSDTHFSQYGSRIQ